LFFQDVLQCCKNTWAFTVEDLIRSCGIATWSVADPPRSNTNVGDKGIEEIAKRSPQLEVLDAG
jgi:hypothetical protein